MGINQTDVVTGAKKVYAMSYECNKTVTHYLNWVMMFDYSALK